MPLLVMLFISLSRYAPSISIITYPAIEFQIFAATELPPAGLFAL